MNPGVNNRIESCLEDVRRTMAACLEKTSLRTILPDKSLLLGQGKMLRARMAFRVGPAAGAPHERLRDGAAAIEIIHSASLLHDDVIDGGYLRRGAPTFWVERGIAGAILLGDLMLFKALELLSLDGESLRMLIRLTGEVCEAESEQELILRGHPTTWDQCVRIARRKTGPLFAFIGFVAGGNDARLRDALTEAGYELGAAYQLADDILDVKGTTESAGKTLGSDEARSKITVAQMPNVDPVAFIDRLLDSARARLTPWPAVQQGWDEYVAEDIRPVLAANLRPAVRET